MAHRIGGRTQDLHLRAQPAIRSGLLISIEEWGRQLTTRGAEIAVPKGVILAAQNEPKLRVSPMVYLQARLKIGFAVSYAIYWESNEDSHVLGSQGSQLASAW